MLIALHKNARTTPAVRGEIAASSETASALAARYGITEQTVYKWKKRSVFTDRSHTAQRLQTTLTPAQEVVVLRGVAMAVTPLARVRRVVGLAGVTRHALRPVRSQITARRRSGPRGPTARTGHR